MAVLVIAHTYYSAGGIFDMTSELIDLHLALDLVETPPLIRAFAERLGDEEFEIGSAS